MDLNLSHVQSLINHDTRRWDNQIIDSLFFPWEAMIIKKNALIMNIEDCLVCQLKGIVILHLGLHIT